MSISRQSVLGITMLIGGCVMLFAMVQQSDSAKSKEKPAQITGLQPPENGSPVLTAADDNELTTDINTENKILEQKQQQREALVKAQEAKSKSFLEEQENAAALALKQTRLENEQFQKNAQPKQAVNTTEAIQAKSNNAVVAQPRVNTTEASQAEAKNAAIAHPKVNTRAAEADRAEKKRNAALVAKARAKAVKKLAAHKTTGYCVKEGDSLSLIAKKHNISTSVLAATNNMHTTDILREGRNIVVPSKKEVARNQSRKNANLSSQQKLVEARKIARKENAKGVFGVQVALAADQEGAEKVIVKLEDAGYKFSTSQTSRGIRVMAGPEKGKIAALALRDKINSDSELKINDAWVLYWR